MSIELDPEQSTKPGPWRAFRNRVSARPTLNLAYRIGVALVGTIVLVIGIVAIPYPGPGWAMVFAGLGILATEFSWARRALGWLRDRYRQVMAWYGARGPVFKTLAALATAALVVATLWILGTFGLIGGWIGVEWQWLRSPLMS
ncbi:TIGR02611 family protein [Nocardia cyriacigeorgica]|uniref:TIGR02611 family protein n=1 Tax=Nocardia cyriacigeorgica TaxID=135487 RepID=UPI0002EAAD26|nr:TIGR02611 family protein [Nocardia cyriacigeorgica]MBF6087881.1 TIGR02611 family protein [Nocardia cyriacigeorgica]MBF6094199.1 TIGR02611 family protein [Nocardia cyriacigeorgica]MBF6322616.1 TIGR02611 family protein [Nocardia cyriacigeorgica]MBF6396162.1 TIGR02611 family protein [Nocardia cyriacigeorgica]MBF6401794.1 TIGR02611 family protein [Nocardia cyriacigeorgica]